jgi:hypothetical protein
VSYDIYHFSKRLRRLEESVRRAENIIDENKLAILKFIEFCQGEGIAPATIMKNVSALRHVDRIDLMPKETLEKPTLFFGVVQKTPHIVRRLMGCRDTSSRVTCVYSAQ